ncbi:MAG: hypothetical protein AB3N33_01950 [Puniceicoccaceae bacterium]
MRTSVTQDEVWVGQRVIVHVEVLGKDGWAQIKRYDRMDVPGAFIMRTQSQGVRIQETIGSERYTGQRYELSVFPQRAGLVEVPSFGAEVATRTWGMNASETTQDVIVPGLTFQARMPPGADGIDWLVSTSRLQVEQEWTSLKESVMVGDSIQRSIRVFAVDIPGMAFARIGHPEINGVSTYPKEPLVEDRTDRGTLSGSRTESMAYVFESPGEIQLPPYEFFWWDMQASVLRKELLPGVTVIVEHNPAMTANGSPNQETGSAGKPWWLLLPVAALIFLAVAFRERFRSRISGWLTKQAASEGIQFRKVRRAVQDGSSQAIMRELMQWLDGMEPEGSPASLTTFLTDYGDASTREIAQRLAALQVEELDPAQRVVFNKGLLAARRNFRRWNKQKGHRLTVASLLPPLN